MLKSETHCVTVPVPPKFCGSDSATLEKNVIVVAEIFFYKILMFAEEFSCGKYMRYLLL
jgi:hypothetical protein